MKNNNMWMALARPLRHRPGDPTPQPKEEPARERARMGRPPKLAASVVLVRQAHRQATEDNPWKLTSRQMQILDMLVQGMTKRQIAIKLTLSYATIACHVGHMQDKMRVSNVAQAIITWHRHYRVMLPALDEKEKAQQFADRLNAAAETSRARNCALRKEAA